MCKLQSPIAKTKPGITFYEVDYYTTMYDYYVV